MPIKWHHNQNGLPPLVLPYPVPVSLSCKAGDVVGITGSTGALVRRLTGVVINASGGVLGIMHDDCYTDSSGNLIAPTKVSTIATNVQADLALSGGPALLPTTTLAGVTTPQALVIVARPDDVFIQRARATSARYHDGLAEDICDLVWNATTLEWEVDSSATSVNDIAIVSVPKMYGNTSTGNFKYRDSATYATDTYAPYVCFKFLEDFCAYQQNLAY